MNYLLSLSILCITSCLSAQTFEWAKNYDYGAHDYGTSIGTDKYGNVYIKGRSHYSTGGSGGYSYSMLWKLNNAGNMVWADTMNTGGSMVTDSLGTMYIAGGIVSKYDNNGQQLWASGSNIAAASFRNISLNPLGGVVTIGNVLISDTTKSILAYYDENGNCLWAKVGLFPPGNISFPLTVDKQGNSYIAGEGYTDSLTGNFGFLAKIDYNGNLLYKYTIPHIPNDIAIDNMNNIYVTGWIPMIYPININGTIYEANYPSDPQPQYVIKYNQQGEVLWHKIIRGQIGRDVIASDATGNIYLSIGFSDITIDSIHLTSSFGRILFMKISSSGNIDWLLTDTDVIAGSYGSSIYPGDIYVNDQNEVFITGAMVGTRTFGAHTISLPTGYTDLFAIKISQQDITTAIAKPAEHKGSLSVFPNPGNGLFTISFIPENTQSTYTYNVINITGQTVYSETVAKTSVYRKQLDLSHLPKGTYYINLYSNPANTNTIKQLKESRKIVLQ